LAVNLNGIDLSGGTATASTRKTTATQTAPVSQDSDATQQRQGEVSITSTASLLANLQQSLAARPAIDQSRVDAVSKALAEGKYTVNPDKIAHGLIQSERALGRLRLPEV